MPGEQGLRDQLLSMGELDEVLDVVTKQKDIKAQAREEKAARLLAKGSLQAILNLPMLWKSVDRSARSLIYLGKGRGRGKGKGKQGCKASTDEAVPNGVENEKPDQALEVSNSQSSPNEPRPKPKARGKHACVAGATECPGEGEGGDELPPSKKAKKYTAPVPASSYQSRIARIMSRQVGMHLSCTFKDKFLKDVVDDLKPLAHLGLTLPTEEQFNKKCLIKHFFETCHA